MTTAILYLLGGFLLLWKGGDLLVDGADRFARSHGMPATLAGVFILGFGTSVPELATSVSAILRGKDGIALGNVVGSNIANIALILGITAALMAVPVRRSLRLTEMPVCLIASGLAVFTAWDGYVSRTDGLILLGAFVLYTLYAVATSKKRERDEAEEVPPKHAAKDLGIAVLGLAAVVAGAQLFLHGAEWIAVKYEWSEAVVGLTIVALGTSLPELATALAAVRAKKPDLALGNVIGSNIFNALLVLGVASVIRSQRLEDAMRSLDFPVMLGLAVFVWILALTIKRVPRAVGVLMVLGWLGFMGFRAGLYG